MSVVENPNEFLFTEKYRPKNLDQIIMSNRLRDECRSYIKDGQIPHLIFAGSAGIGKCLVGHSLVDVCIDITNLSDLQIKMLEEYKI